MGSTTTLILIVDADVAGAGLTAHHLEAVKFRTLAYPAAGPVRRFLARNFANLMLLDPKLPDLEGHALMAELDRQRRRPPTIITSPNREPAAVVKSLELGADDYVVKPYSVGELIARIRAVLRRAETRRDQYVTGNLRIDDDPFEFEGGLVHPAALSLSFGPASVRLGKKELGLLAYFKDHPGLSTRKTIIHTVWGPHANPESRSLDQYLLKIKAAYTGHGQPLTALTCLHGTGYRYSPSRELTEPALADSSSAPASSSAPSGCQADG